MLQLMLTLTKTVSIYPTRYFEIQRFMNDLSIIQFGAKAKNHETQFETKP